MNIFYHDCILFLCYKRLNGKNIREIIEILLGLDEAVLSWGHAGFLLFLLQ